MLGVKPMRNDGEFLVGVDYSPHSREVFYFLENLSNQTLSPNQLVLRGVVKFEDSYLSKFNPLVLIGVTDDKDRGILISVKLVPVGMVGPDQNLGVSVCEPSFSSTRVLEACILSSIKALAAEYDSLCKTLFGKLREERMRELLRTYQTEMFRFEKYPSAPPQSQDPPCPEETTPEVQVEQSSDPIQLSLF
jgi:hypothetical protein